MMSAFSLLMFCGTAWVFFGRLSSERSAHFAFCESADSAFTSGGSAHGAYYFWAYVYYLSKYVELLDTVFLALKGKLVGWGGLNVYHHSLVVFMAWLWLDCAQSLQHIGILANTAVHVVMYAYFCLQSLGHSPRWKPLVTQMQIVQFVFSFLCLGVNLHIHFADAETMASGGCQGQKALLFNSAFNCTLLLEFVAICGRNQKQAAAQQAVQAASTAFSREGKKAAAVQKALKSAGVGKTAAVAPLLSSSSSSSDDEKSEPGWTTIQRKAGKRAQ